MYLGLGLCDSIQWLNSGVYLIYLQFSKIVILETGYHRYSRMLYVISGGFIRTRFYANHIGRMPVSSFDSDSVYLKLFGTILSKCVPLSHGRFSN